MSRRGKYDWRAWFRQDRVVLHRGIDYHISQSMMYQSIKNSAPRFGVRVKLLDCGNYIVIEVTERYGQGAHSGTAPAVTA